MHHDCKLNNLLLDAETGEALCVIDLDTVMEGSVLSDFGELVRTATSHSPEDETRLETIAFDLSLFEALAKGYAAGAADWLSEAEGRLLPLAGPALALMNAIRFLADFVAGDVYFRVHREGHNLDRHRAQLGSLRRGARGCPRRSARRPPARARVVYRGSLRPQASAARERLRLREVGQGA
jgi:hypothetical protein